MDTTVVDVLEETTFAVAHNGTLLCPCSFIIITPKSFLRKVAQHPENKPK